MSINMGEAGSQSIPLPLLDRDFVRGLRERLAQKDGFEPVELRLHNREYADEVDKKAQIRVYDQLIEIAGKVDLVKILNEVFSPDPSDDQSWEDVERIIALAKKIEEMSREKNDTSYFHKRKDALSFLYGD